MSSKSSGKKSLVVLPRGGLLTEQLPRQQNLKDEYAEEAPKSLVEVKPVEEKPAEVKPAEVKPVEVKPVEVKPVEVKPIRKPPDLFLSLKDIEEIKSLKKKKEESPISVSSASSASSASSLESVKGEKEKLKEEEEEDDITTKKGRRKFLKEFGSKSKKRILKIIGCFLTPFLALYYINHLFKEFNFF